MTTPFAGFTFAKRVRDIQVSAIKRMPLVARNVPGAISLGQGIPSIPTPLYIRRKVIELLSSQPAIGKYSLQPGLPELKTVIADRLSARIDAPVNPDEQIFISAGAMEALFAALVSIVETGDEVLLFDPSYASHIEQVLFSGGVPVFVPLAGERGWALDIEQVRSKITPKTKAIVICNPVNPTGKVFSRAELQSLASLAREFGLVVIADETYDFLVYGDLRFTSLLDFPEIREQTIACYSFSKQFAMTGWRVGYMYAPQAVIEQALKVHDAAVICAPTISQYAAYAALTERSDEPEDLRTILDRRRNLACDRLDRLKDLFSYVRPDGAYYLFVRYLKTDLDSEQFAMKVLEEAKVITIPGRAFGPHGEGHIRLSYGGTEEEITLAFDRLEQWNKTL